MSLSELEVALIVLGSAIGCIITGILLCRILGVWRMVSCFATGEEKQQLTKHAYTGNGYMNTSDSTDFALDMTGKFMDYDTLSSDPAYSGIAQESVRTSAVCNVEQSGRSSPVSVDNESIASEHEAVLYKAMSCDSLASDSSVLDIQPESPKIGQLEFGLEYDREVGELIVSVIQVKDLEANEVTGTVDSYVKVILAPDSEKRVTKVRKQTIHPQFKERFLYNVEPGDRAGDIDDKTVHFQVFSCDKYARHKLLGQNEIKIGDIDIMQPVRIWLNLMDMDESKPELGDIMFSLSYLPTAERLTAVVVKARSLKFHNNTDTGDVFVKVYLLHNGKKIQKKRTSMKRDVKTPVFNEAMIFAVPQTALGAIQLRLTVTEQLADHSSLSVGHVIVGANTSGQPLSHWNQMINMLRKPVAMWHSLHKR